MFLTVARSQGMARLPQGGGVQERSCRAMARNLSNFCTCVMGIYKHIGMQREDGPPALGGV